MTVTGNNSSGITGGASGIQATNSVFANNV
jgi:hypothetical protein